MNARDYFFYDNWFITQDNKTSIIHKITSVLIITIDIQIAPKTDHATISIGKCFLSTTRDTEIVTKNVNQKHIIIYPTIVCGHACKTDKIHQKANIILFAVWILGNDDASIFCNRLVAWCGSGLGL